MVPAHSDPSIEEDLQALRARLAERTGPNPALEWKIARAAASAIEKLALRDEFEQVLEVSGWVRERLGEAVHGRRPSVTLLQALDRARSRVAMGPKTSENFRRVLEEIDLVAGSDPDPEGEEVVAAARMDALMMAVRTGDEAALDTAIERLVPEAEVNESAGPLLSLAHELEDGDLVAIERFRKALTALDKRVEKTLRTRLLRIVGGEEARQREKEERLELARRVAHPAVARLGAILGPVRPGTIVNPLSVSAETRRAVLPFAVRGWCIRFEADTGFDQPGAYAALFTRILAAVGASTTARDGLEGARQWLEVAGVGRFSMEVRAGESARAVALPLVWTAASRALPEGYELRQIPSENQTFEVLVVPSAALPALAVDAVFAALKVRELRPGKDVRLEESAPA